LAPLRALHQRNRNEDALSRRELEAASRAIKFFLSIGSIVTLPVTG
jgi:hypothetical protein